MARWLALLAFFTLSSCAVVSNDRGDTAGGPSSPQQQPSIQTVQPGDRELTCEDLMAQMTQMDQIASYSTSGGANTGSSVTKAVVATAASQAMGFIPIVGPVLGSVAGAVSDAVGNSSQPQMQQENTITLAQQRKQHLLNLFDEKKCSAPSSSPQP